MAARLGMGRDGVGPLLKKGGVVATAASGRVTQYPTPVHFDVLPSLHSPSKNSSERGSQLVPLPGRRSLLLLLQHTAHRPGATTRFPIAVVVAVTKLLDPASPAPDQVLIHAARCALLNAQAQIVEASGCCAGARALAHQRLRRASDSSRRAAAFSRRMYCRSFFMRHTKRVRAWHPHTPLHVPAWQVSFECTSRWSWPGGVCFISFLACGRGPIDPASPAPASLH